VASILDRVLRIGEGRQLKKLQSVAVATKALEPRISDMSDEELKAQTAKFKQRLHNGESLDDLMPEAFATVREAAKRVIGQRPYDVQVMGAAALHWGNIAEMKTGEGKTLVATMPSYLNALSGKGVHVVTVNDYLASYQSELMGRIHRFLGLSVGCILTSQKPAERRKQYNCDITYGTNNEFGFDYLRDNMAWDKSDLVQRGHHYAIVDEVDSILIDEARTPLIISGPSEGDVTRWYREFAKFVPGLKRDVDYEVDEKKKTVGIKEPGIAKVEDWLGIDNLYEPQNTALIGYLNNAIKAKELFLRDKDYVVTNGQVLIVDEHTGRVLPGRRYNEGLHQALEAKENVEIHPENQTYATITLQNYFRMYDKLSGMTGTAETEAAEFQNTYKLGVIPIPTNKPMIRKDRDDLIFRTKQEKLSAIIKDVARRYRKGQPVLLGTASVESSEVVSALLDRAHIPHTVLNAKHHEREAAVVAVAGRKGAITVATNMAGRGTDIMLGGNVEFLADQDLKKRGYSPEDTPEEYEKLWGPTLAKIKAQVKDEHEEVVKLGGLYVLGTERHESRRIDNQLRGRSGRQGDPGESRFYLSLEDDLMRLFNTQLVARVMRQGLPEGQPIESKSVSKGVRNAQKAVESRNYEIRKNVLKYDDVMNKQRTVIYAERQKVLMGENVHQTVMDFMKNTINAYAKAALPNNIKPSDWDVDALWQAYAQLYPISLSAADEKKKAAALKKHDKAIAVIEKDVFDDAKAQYDKRESEMGEDFIKDLECRVLLAVLDRKWREHLYEMDYLKDGIGLRGMGQRDPLVEYQREGFRMYNSMVEAIEEESVQLLFHLDLQQIKHEEEQARQQAESDTQLSGPTEPSQEDDDLDEDETAADEAHSADSDSDDELESHASQPIVGMQPLTHEDREISVSTRIRNGQAAELRVPWADGRTFSGTPKNAPCPCGSGRKYKMCHGQNEVHQAQK
jgi:preprotein translocase subunit SecA